MLAVKPLLWYLAVHRDSKHHAVVQSRHQHDGKCCWDFLWNLDWSWGFVLRSAVICRKSQATASPLEAVSRKVPAEAKAKAVVHQDFAGRFHAA